MPMRVLVVPDKFKGTLTAQQAAEAIAKGWNKSRPQDLPELLPMSDGGEGFGAVIGQSLAAKEVLCQTMDAAHRSCKAAWWWDRKTKTAIIETSAVVGLAMLPPKRFHPFDLDTFGLGKVIESARRRGAKVCLVGIGGSATNDAGFGLARSLGWKFLNAKNQPIERWVDLERLESIVCPPRDSEARAMEIRVAVDVQNKLLGPKGASRVYGPQKGLRKGDFARAEACLGRLALVARKLLRTDFSRVPGSGAAGGLGFGLAAFLGARLEPGFELFAQQANLHQRLKQADLVITGEGAIDESSLMGKGVGQIARQCKQLGIPCIGLAGKIVPSPVLAKTFSRICGLTQIASATEATARAAVWLSRLAQAVAREWEAQEAKA